MYNVYKILSGECWNGQTQITDFYSVELVASFDTLDETLSFIGDLEDLFYQEF